MTVMQITEAEAAALTDDTDVATVCDCCALVVANADASGCRDYYGHTHTEAMSKRPGMWIVVGAVGNDWQTMCDGCGNELGEVAHEVERVA